MHQYLEAIGFEGIQSKQELRDLLQEVENTFTHQIVMSYTDEEDFCELKKEYAQSTGIAVCGELDKNDQFDADYYFPYFEGSGVTTCAEITVEKKIDKEQYVGICEDPRAEFSLMFHLQNGIEYVKESQFGYAREKEIPVTLSGLALKGTILFPISKSEEQQKQEREESRNRKKLLSAARRGDQIAMETLTMDDIDIYSKVSRRLASEDVFSIVNTYFMPHGIECDLYAILGEILAVRERVNSRTGEKLYQMKLNVNELQIDICVPKKRVLGEPEIGRRFKGKIWLQGYLHF